MHSLAYSIHSQIFEDHPDYCRGVVVFEDLDNTSSSPGLSAALSDSEASVRTRITGNPAEFPQIAAWREAYRSFGAKPSEHRSSIEAMARRVIRPDNLPDINPLVDIGNLLSLRHLLPAGVHPLTGESTNIELRPSLATERFLSDVNGDTEHVDAGEIVLAVGLRVLTRRWTWRQAADTRTLPDTRTVFLDIDGLLPTSRKVVEVAMSDAVVLVSKYCGGKCAGFGVLDKDQPTLTLSFG